MDLRACIQKIESITGLQFPPILPVAKLDWHRFKATSVRPLYGASVSALLSLMATGAPAASAFHRPSPSLYRFGCISRSKQQNPNPKPQQQEWSRKDYYPCPCTTSHGRAKWWNAPHHPSLLPCMHLPFRSSLPPPPSSDYVRVRMRRCVCVNAASVSPKMTLSHCLRELPATVTATQRSSWQLKPAPAREHGSTQRLVDGRAARPQIAFIS